MIDLFSVQASSAHPTLVMIVYSQILAFLLSGTLAWAYDRTFRGLSFSRNYLQSLVLGALVATTILQAIGDSMARGLGLMGAMALVRFRVSLKDPRDILFLFASFAAGIACGVGAFGIAIVGTGGFILANWILSITRFGGEPRHDGLLRLQVEDTPDSRKAIESILEEHLDRFTLITLREAAGTRLDMAYQVRLKTAKTASDLISALRRVPGIAAPYLMLQEAVGEI